jgi:hypothetical protein
MCCSGLSIGGLETFDTDPLSVVESEPATFCLALAELDQGILNLQNDPDPHNDPASHSWVNPSLCFTYGDGATQN